MRILFLANAASIHTVRWVNTLSERGHKIHLVFNSDHIPTYNKISGKIILHRLKYSGTKSYFMNAPELNRLYKRIKPDIVNAHYASGYGTLARLSRLKPLVISVWGSDIYKFPHESKMKMKLITKNLLYADKIASTSHCMAERVRTLMSGCELDISITPFGVDTKEFTSEKVFTQTDDIVIGNIKTLSKTYGIDDFILSIKKLKYNLEGDGRRDLADKIKVVIYGDGNQKDELNKLIEDIDLKGVVSLMGSIPNSEVPVVLEKFDIFCATSLQESFGVALVEAMAMGLPVVATDAEGFKEVVEDGITGFIVQKQNSSDIAKMLQILVMDDDLRIAMGCKGRERVLRYYDWEKNVDVMEKILFNIMKDEKV